jgi:hypothetical protein
MTISLTDIWTIENPTRCKVHFARWNGSDQPLEVFVRDRQDWVAACRAGSDAGEPAPPVGIDARFQRRDP